MARPSAASRLFWRCSIPARLGCRSSTSTTATAPRTRRARSITASRRAADRDTPGPQGRGAASGRGRLDHAAGVRMGRGGWAPPGRVRLRTQRGGNGSRPPHPEAAPRPRAPGMALVFWHMRIAYFDCPSGAAGDMVVAALVDAGAPLDALRHELEKLPLEGWKLVAREVRKAGFRATKVDVDIDPRTHQHHRTLGDILAILERSGLAAAVRAKAARIFARLAEAEARAHGTTRDQVHFHDVGAVDAIVDVTGAVVALELLGVQAVHVSALPLGGGFADGPHGRIPVPGPATAELLKGFPVVDTGVRRELVTPTGAAILTTLAVSAGAMPAMTVTAVGCGAGSMELDTPNVVRVFVGEAGEGIATETICQVETTVDDMSPQLYESLMERLFEAGALDVYLTPVLMKKTRPGVVVTALSEP